ncbi:FAD-dependent monooxygenase [Streptomyces europaeiscabiei]|uniref:FAD-dependent monooxygenase n=1 Tax=Streptomyces europaeiscabiei TaxID=146819 RepID=UPI0029A91AC5|nr:FAD-dependent monooxygenase [Streptomyces europaeiscabiei]MDX2527550.1 FAD-dependent monooxygenase [Streptomyces europaeiscabiei]MDX2773901.1 FAD-dependent monooxygenase [Streptomyces europaeiscabiei]MDX3835062.1 FAD-dependent monooxygenase [Streptomyces europaeiscabiei]MDX3863092.1 FAD-dependent monooxygenase [Streptomyces europaeiscabiei]MDX3871816.1 FAD-dependent monooxygenase [Streptomyces europaeiscabiei]
MRAIVVGAGIGGLAATLSLRRAGCEVTLVEQAPRFTEVGAGIQLAPNATRVLRRLGLLDAVAARSSRPSRLSFRTWSDGGEICGYALGREAEAAFGAPYLQAHRADLHEALAAAVPPESVRLNTVVVGIGQDGRSARVTTADGECLEADLVVAADGVRSRARQWLFGDDEALFSGTVAYRALLPAGEVTGLDLPEYALWLGPGRHFVHYWVRRGDLLNVVGVIETGAAQESWTARAEPGECLRAFDRWDPRVLDVLGRTGTVLRYGIHTRAPLTRWNTGRVTLLGDSAHAMVPFQAQGAAQALVDAAVLGDCLADAAPADVPDALDRYVRRRLATATKVQAGSARAGEDYHLPDGPQARARNDRLAAQAAENGFGPHAGAWGLDTFDEQAS